MESSDDVEAFKEKLQFGVNRLVDLIAEAKKMLEDKNFDVKRAFNGLFAVNVFDEFKNGALSVERINEIVEILAFIHWALSKEVADAFELQIDVYTGFPVFWLSQMKMHDSTQLATLKNQHPRQKDLMQYFINNRSNAALYDVYSSGDRGVSYIVSSQGVVVVEFGGKGSGRVSFFKAPHFEEPLFVGESDRWAKVGVNPYPYDIEDMLPLNCLSRLYPQMSKVVSSQGSNEMKSALQVRMEMSKYFYDHVGKNNFIPIKIIRSLGDGVDLVKNEKTGEVYVVEKIRPVTQGGSKAKMDLVVEYAKRDCRHLNVLQPLLVSKHRDRSVTFELEFADAGSVSSLVDFLPEHSRPQLVKSFIRQMVEGVDYNRVVHDRLPRYLTSNDIFVRRDVL